MLLFFWAQYISMIGYLEGVWFNELVLTKDGVGYIVHVTQTFSEGEQVKLWIVPVYTDKSQTLYGYTSTVQQHLHKLLTSVPGVGPATAHKILAANTAGTIIAAIDSNDPTTVGRLKSVSSKPAIRTAIAGIKLPPELSAQAEDLLSADQQQAAAALISLGFDEDIAHLRVASLSGTAEGIVAQVLSAS